MLLNRLFLLDMEALKRTGSIFLRGFKKNFFAGVVPVPYPTGKTRIVRYPVLSVKFSFM